MHICEADRLILRRLSLDDVPALAKILSDPDVMKYSVRGVCDEAATHQFIEWCLACYDSLNRHQFSRHFSAVLGDAFHTLPVTTAH